MAIANLKKFVGASLKKFEWQATESAPRSWPMRIVAGRLHYVDGSGAMYVPDSSDIDAGWGDGISSHVVGDDLKLLPNRLTITFFSYTEDQFYRGDFDLPYDKILSLFQKGFYSPVNDKHITYDNIIVGVAPGGAVAVWLWGYEKTTEVFFGQAEKVDLPWSTLTSATHITREEYVRQNIVESLKTPEALEALRKNGVPIGLWNTYRTRYHWQPVFTNMTLLEGRITLINYFNGECDYINYPLERHVAESTRAVPKNMTFIWDQPNAKPLRIKLFFDEAEIFSTFKKLAADSLPLQLEMRIAVINGKNDFTVWLKNEKTAIEIKQMKVETYGIPAGYEVRPAPRSDK